MKRLILAVTFLFTVATTIAQDKKNSVKVNPLAFLIDSSSMVSYERAITSNLSGVISGGFGSVKAASLKYSSKGVGLQTRYYFSEVLNGWYGAGKFSYSDLSVKNTTSGNVRENAPGRTATKFGVLFGYQWVFDSGFTMDLNGGYSKVMYKNKAENSGNDNGDDNVNLPSFAFALGYTF